MIIMLLAGVLHLVSPPQAIAAGPGETAKASCRGIWLCPEEIRRLPRTGAAWKNVLSYADKPLNAPNLSDQEETANIETLARALAFARTQKEHYRAEVITTLRHVMGTERGGRTLSLARGLISYVIAADIVGLPPDLEKEFSDWLIRTRDLPLRGQTLRTTHEDRPNNWGTHASASRLAVARYLGDKADVARVARIFKGFLGDRASYDGFSFRERHWQADPRLPVGINPAGAVLHGHNVDGVLPDDQRRCCSGFKWPPPKENYVYEALQGIVTTALLLEKAGYDDVWKWEDQALLRAFRWLHEVGDYPVEGDDEWQTHIINYAYGTDFPAPTPAQPGKGFGFTDWVLSSASQG